MQPNCGLGLLDLLVLHSQAICAVMSHQIQWHHCFVRFLHACVHSGEWAPCWRVLRSQLLDLWRLHYWWVAEPLAHTSTAALRWCYNASMPGPGNSSIRRRHEVIGLCTTLYATVHVHIYIFMHVLYLQFTRVNTENQKAPMHITHMYTVHCTRWCIQDVMSDWRNLATHGFNFIVVLKKIHWSTKQPINIYYRINIYAFG